MARLSVLLTLAFLATLALSAPQTKPVRGNGLPSKNSSSATTTTALKFPLETTALPPVTSNGTNTTTTGIDDDDDSPAGTTSTTRPEDISNTTTVLPLVSNGETIGNVSLEATTFATPLNETTAGEAGNSTATSKAPNAEAAASTKPVTVTTTESGFWKRLTGVHIALIVLAAASALLMISCLMSCLVFGEGAFYLVSCGPCRKR